MTEAQLIAEIKKQHDAKTGTERERFETAVLTAMGGVNVTADVDNRTGIRKLLEG